MRKRDRKRKTPKPIERKKEVEFTEVFIPKQMKAKKIKKIVFRNKIHKTQAQGRYPKKKTISIKNYSKEEMLGIIRQEIKRNTMRKKRTMVVEKNLQQKRKAFFRDVAVELVHKYYREGVDESTLKCFFPKRILIRYKKMMKKLSKRLPKEMANERLETKVKELIHEYKGNITKKKIRRKINEQRRETEKQITIHTLNKVFRKGKIRRRRLKKDYKDYTKQDVIEKDMEFLQKLQITSSMKV